MLLLNLWLSNPLFLDLTEWISHWEHIKNPVRKIQVLKLPDIAIWLVTLVDQLP